MRGTRGSSYTFFNWAHTTAASFRLARAFQRNNMTNSSSYFSSRRRGKCSSISTYLGPGPQHFLLCVVILLLFNIGFCTATSDTGKLNVRSRRSQYGADTSQPVLQQKSRPKARDTQNDDMQDLEFDEVKDDVKITRFDNRGRGSQNYDQEGGRYALLENNGIGKINLDPRNAKRFAENVAEAVLANADKFYEPMEKGKREDLSKLLNSALQMNPKLEKYRIC